MSVYPGAAWRPIPSTNFTPGGCTPRLIVLHVMEGTLDGTDTWFRNPQAQASAHFGVGRDGRRYQWVNTADTAWAQMAGNPYAMSIECEGRTGDPLTGVQLDAVAGIVEWAALAHSIPLHVTDDPAGSGLGWHGMGGADWGSHFDCPGDPIKAQRPQILAAAGRPTPSPSPGDDPDMILIRSASGAIAITDGTSKVWVEDGNSLAALEAKLGPPVQLSDAMYAYIPNAVPNSPANRG